MTERSIRPCARPARSGPVPTLWVAVLAVGLAACRTYEPWPLEPSEHRAAWHGRDLGSSSVAGFLERVRARTGRERPFDASDGLDLEEAELAALVFHPELRVARLRLARGHASADASGVWQDPELSLELLRIDDDVPDRWFVAPSLGVTLPLSGRLGAEEDLAGARVRLEELRVLELEREVVLRLREAWSAWSAAELRRRETEQLVATLVELERTTRELADIGELPRTEAALFALDRSQRVYEIARLEGELASLEQRVRARMGLAPDAPAELRPALPEGAPAAVPATVPEEHPTLRRLRAEYEVAERALAREVRGQYPDLVVGPALEEDAGQTRVGLFGALRLPLWNRNQRAIAEALAERRVARAAYEAGYEGLAARLAAASARLGALERQGELLEGELVPRVDAQLADALGLLELGEGSSLVLLESLKRSHVLKLEWLDVRADAALARAELDALTGDVPAHRLLLPTETETRSSDDR